LYIFFFFLPLMVVVVSSCLITEGGGEFVKGWAFSVFGELLLLGQFSETSSV
jgi:hypothetical protein